MAEWNRDGGLTCNTCIDYNLLEQGLADCETCNKPRPLPANLLTLELYSFNPVSPVPMTDGLVMLNISDIKFLMDTYEVELEDRKLLLEKIAIYHSTLYSKKGLKKEDNKGELM